MTPIDDIPTPQLTAYEAYKASLEAFDSSSIDVINGLGPEFGTMYTRLIGHPIFNMGIDEETERHAFGAAIVIRTACAPKIFLELDHVAKLNDLVRAKVLPGFAGDKCPEHKLPAANVVFGIHYPDSECPIIVPKNDMLGTNHVSVRSVLIHAIHAGAIEHTPTDEMTLDWAQIIAHVTTCDGISHTYAGTIEYGKGGAQVWPVVTIDELIGALDAKPPQRFAALPMTNMSQYVCGTLAYLLHYHKLTGVYELLMSVAPVTTPTEESTFGATETRV